MRPSPKGMTLIELILVMGLLGTVLAFAAPRLSGFFEGRGLNENARRVLELTFYARSEAISRSVPMELWFDGESGEYGVKPSAGFEYDEKTPVQYSLPDDLHFDIDEKSVDEDGLVTILFQPDGSLDEVSSANVRILERDNTGLEIVQSENKLGYVIERAEIEQSL